MKSLNRWLKQHKRLITYTSSGLLVLIVVGAVFFRGNHNGDQTLVVHPADFIQQVSVSGKVMAAENVNLGFDQGGRVAGVYAAVGDTVPAGKVLANVENGDLRADLATEEANLAALKRGTRPEELKLTESKVVNNQTAANTAEAILASSLADAYAKADDAVRNNIDQFFISPRSSSAQLAFSISDNQLTLTINSDRVRVEQDLLAWEKILTSKPTPSPGNRYAAESNYLLRVKSFLDEVSLAANDLASGATVNGLTANQIRANVSSARTGINTAITNLATAEDKWQTAKANLTLAQGQLTLDQAGSTLEDLVAGQARVDADRAKLGKTMVVAPFDGVVTKMDAKVGESVSPNTSVISLIGANGTFQIESYVPEINVALLAVGNTATVTLDAYGTDVPFTAKVISIDPAETIRDGVSTYKTKLQFTSKDERIKSGMTANVLITTASKSNVISVPQGIVKTVNSQKFVPVKENDKIVDRLVTTGQVSSLGQIEILSGLQDGDTVVLPANN